MTLKAPRPAADRAAHGAGDFEAVSDSFNPPNSIAPNQVKRVVHIVVGLRCIGLFVKTGAGPLELITCLPYRSAYKAWDQVLVESLRKYDEAGDEFAPVRLTGHAFDNPLSQALARAFMQAGLMVSNQTFSALGNDDSQQRRKRHQRNWLYALDGKMPGPAYMERAKNSARRNARIWRQELLAAGRENSRRGS